MMMRALVAALALSSAAAFSTLTTTTRRTTPLRAEKKEPYEVVLLRHGESTWNDLGLFTGWYDCPLSEAGIAEARDGGRLLKEEGYEFDLCYTSYLKRAISTLWLALEELDQQYVPIVHSWRLNERHYGALQGKDKKETVRQFGNEQVQIWRRSYDVPPPPVDEDSEHFPGNERKYKDVPVADLPRCESLKLTEERVKPEWENDLLPQIKAGKRILIAAHGNTLRALAKLLDDIEPDVITGLNIPTGVPLVYSLDPDTLKPVPHPDAIAPLTARYLGDPEDIKRRIGAVQAQTAAAPVAR